MTFGPYDFVHVYEAPNDEAMAKFVMTLASFGNVRTTVMRAWDELRASSAHTRAFMTCPLSGTKQTCAVAPQMSAFGGKADMTFCGANVCF